MTYPQVVINFLLRDGSPHDVAGAMAVDVEVEDSKYDVHRALSDSARRILHRSHCVSDVIVYFDRILDGLFKEKCAICDRVLDKASLLPPTCVVAPSMTVAHVRCKQVAANGTM